MRKLISVIAVTSTFAFSMVGCGDEASHDVSWYIAHDAERVVKVKECNNNPGELAFTPNCVNANKAKKKVELRDFVLTPVVIDPNIKFIPDAKK